MYRVKSRDLFGLHQISLLFLVAFVFGAPAWAAEGPKKDREVLVKLKADVSQSEQQDVDAQADADVDQAIASVQGGTIRLIRSRSKGTDQLVADLSRHPAVLYAQPNYIHHVDVVPNDPRFGELWGLLNTGQNVPGSGPGRPGADIKAEPAWTVTTGTSTVVVGVVDTGIDYTHPDLAANVWSNPGGIGGCPIGTHGYDAITRTCDPADDHYHGTHVSGTIGARGNNAQGVVGVNWTTSIMGLKFLDASGSGSTADAITAIDFAVNAKIAGVNVRVLSNSWGGGPFEQALLDEINKANANDILFVAAAGNAGTNNDVTPHYPSSYNTPNMVAVAATDNNDLLASFSQYGAQSVHLGAPGVNVLSTLPANSYDYLSGTSMATPHVAGAAALILSRMVLTTAQLKSQILNNVDPIASLSGKTVTGGRLNVCKAIPGCGAPPVPDFSLSITPSSTSVTAGASASYAVSINRSGGFTGAVSLSVSGLPAGASGSFSPNPSSTNTSTLTVATSSNTLAGSYVLTTTGVNGSLTRTATATLVVNPAASPDFSLSVSPSSVSVPAAGGTATYTVNITRTGGFTASVSLSMSGLPPGASGAFSPNPSAGNSSTLTVTVSSTTAAGSYPLTVTGSGGSPTLTRTATATLVKPSSAPPPCDGECP